MHTEQPWWVMWGPGLTANNWNLLQRSQTRRWLPSAFELGLASRLLNRFKTHCKMGIGAPIRLVVRTFELLAILPYPQRNSVVVSQLNFSVKGIWVGGQIQLKRYFGRLAA